MKLHNILLGFAILFSVGANAAPTEKLVLKDGSVLEGHIVSQVPGKHITFSSELSTVVVSGSAVNINGTQEEDYNELSDAWKSWFKAHKEYIMKKSGKDYVKMTTISVDRSARADTSRTSAPKNLLVGSLSSGRVKVLQQGATVKYVDMKKYDFTVNYKDVAEIQRIPRAKEVMSGIVDVVVDKNNREYRGQIVSQKLGNSISVLTDDGDVIEVPVKQIKSQKKEGLNEKMSLIEQSEYLDVVRSKGASDVTGVISNQSSDENGSFILVKTSDDNMERIQNNKIISITKQLNSAYQTPITDVIIENDSIYLCRKSAPKLTALTNDNYVYLKTDSIPFTLSLKDMKDDQLVVECFNNTENSDMILVPCAMHKIVTEKPKRDFYSFSYKDLSEAAVKKVDVSDKSPNNTLRTVYNVKKGVYALYRSNDKMCILFEITD